MSERQQTPVERIREQRYVDRRRGLDFGDLHGRTRDRDPGAWQVLLRGWCGAKRTLHG